MTVRLAPALLPSSDGGRYRLSPSWRHRDPARARGSHLHPFSGRLAPGRADQPFASLLRVAREYSDHDGDAATDRAAARVFADLARTVRKDCRRAANVCVGGFECRTIS